MKEKLKEKLKKNQKGITLIALVITIIVLLILAGVSIATLTGENGVLTQAQNAKTETDKAGIIESAQVDLLDKQAENQSGIISQTDLEKVLGKYFELPEDFADKVKNGEDVELQTKAEYGNYNIKLSEIYDGKIEQVQTQEPISKTVNYVGYYADLTGNGSVDGIIYADLAKGNKGDGQWANEGGNYNIPQKENVKEYYISNQNYEGVFGSAPVLAPIEGSQGEDRFFVMALEDIDGKQNGTQYCWYDDAYGNLKNPIEGTVDDFDKGKENTKTMLEIWDKEEWGYKNQGTYPDIWGIQTLIDKNKSEEEWFVPSKTEWAAFGGELLETLGINQGTYLDYGLSDCYWSSSQYYTYYAYYATNNYWGIDAYHVTTNFYVRLSATF